MGKLPVPSYYLPMTKDITTFVLPVTDKQPLLDALALMNEQEELDFELQAFQGGRDGQGTITVSRDKFAPRHLFLLGINYMRMRQTSI